MSYDGVRFIMTESNEVFEHLCIRPEVAAKFGYFVDANARHIGSLILFHAPNQFHEPNRCLLQNPTN